MLHFWHDLTAADELAPVRKAWFSTVTEVVENIGEWLEEDDQVFIKASNSMGFQTLLNHLLGTTH